MLSESPGVVSSVQILFAENSFHVCDCINKINNILPWLTGPAEFLKREFKILETFKYLFQSSCKKMPSGKSIGSTLKVVTSI